MSKVFVLDTDKNPLNPVHPGRARMLLNQGKAAVWKRYPFTIILKETINDPKLEPLRLKIDPGAKHTGFALINDATGEVVWAAELEHRGFAIRDALTSRRGVRRSRRQRHTRYRKPPKHEWTRKGNRKPTPKHRREDWLAPSLNSRIENIMTWVSRLSKLCPVVAISQELVKFDLQAIVNPEISGIEYQQGQLFGYEVREYLLEKWNRQCAYCKAKNVPLQIEHILSRSKGGSNRVSNLCLACESCNTRKGTSRIEDFLKDDPETLSHILAHVKVPLSSAAAVNTTRWALKRKLEATGLPLEVGTGGLTKFNRTTRGLEKVHWIDACCVGHCTPSQLVIKGIKPLHIKATGHGNRQMCGTNKQGFPIRHRSRIKRHFGFQTGDIVKAVVTSGKKVGTYVGRVLCRKSGSFDITTSSGRITGINHRYCKGVYLSDGYSYS